MRRLWNRIRFGVRLAQLVVTRRCNLSCTYCNEFDRTSEPVPTDVVKRRVDRCAELGTLFMEYTGGEPLLHPDLIELVEHMSKHRFFERWIITNAYLLTKDVVAGLNDAGLTHLQISLDGVTPNDVTKKVLKPLRRKLEMVAKEASFKVQVNVVIGSAPPEEATEAARFIKDLGMIPRACFIHDGDGRLILDPAQRDAFAEIKAIVGGRYAESGSYRDRLLNEGSAPFKCRAGSRYIYVDEHGKVHWCSQQMRALGKDLETYTWEDLKTQFYTRKSCADQCTVGCVRSAGRFDEWREQPLETELPAD